eukprot:TRINITY_DN25500_c0_g1_i1.p1 TRINITY_DN25500_c0_g1~~TRINITY_DN25500_c0_g1_i1.p1  ORF type:complete len:1076 (+),score=260.58 TRINITY_DN25500_c0_g1_i1:22-3249(+)
MYLKKGARGLLSGRKCSFKRRIAPVYNRSSTPYISTKYYTTNVTNKRKKEVNLSGDESNWYNQFMNIVDFRGDRDVASLLSPSSITSEGKRDSSYISRATLEFVNQQIGGTQLGRSDKDVNQLGGDSKMLKSDSSIHQFEDSWETDTLKTEEPELAAIYFQQFEERGIVPPIGVWNHLMKINLRDGKPEKAQYYADKLQLIGAERVVTSDKDTASLVKAARTGIYEKHVLDKDVEEHLASVAVPKGQEAVYKKQVGLELKAVERAVMRYNKVRESLVQLGIGATTFTDRLLLRWYTPVCDAIQKELEEIKSGVSSADRSNYGPYITQLPADKLTVLTLHEVVGAVFKSPTGCLFLDTAYELGRAVCTEVNYEQMKKSKEKYLDQQKTPGAINKLAAKVLPVSRWPKAINIKVGAALIDIFIQHARTAVDEISLPSTLKNTLSFDEDTPSQAAFEHRLVIAGRNKRVGLIVPSVSVLQALTDSDNRNTFFQARYLPMLVPPLKWVSPTNGGYLLPTTRENSPIMRFRGSKLQSKKLRDGKDGMRQIYNVLNLLSRTPWNINEEVYKAIDTAWSHGGGIADIPQRSDIPLPKRPSEVPDDPVEPEHKEAISKWRRSVARTLNDNRNLHSLRCDTIYKLTVAKEFIGKKFYYPHNMDFRGRVYPIPPHLNHLGQDYCRALLVFHDGVPLGPNGFRWLKIQLANVYGVDKVPFDDRVIWADQHMKEIEATADDPLNAENTWWLKGDNPWQILGTCQEIMRAKRYNGPGGIEAYVSTFPVHQDGSCNGLQHYAALGRDEIGGKNVNLLPSDRPQDVYSGVLKGVLRRIDEDAAAGDPIAAMLQGKIDRKVIKQTVMTSVYGVTRIGARSQIQNALRDKKVIDREHEFKASMYITNKVFDSLRDMFSDARATMKWLGDCAKVIAKSGDKNNTVCWTTPLGLPVVQPYRKGGSQVVRTVSQNIILANNKDDLKVNSSKQRTAFPPNYVHSLDSTHMMMTALKCNAEGVTFAAVHDSFWTHAGTVDKMNVLLREAFVELHEQDLLGNLAREMKENHPELDFPPVPAKGNLNIQDIMNSRYFFH